MHLETHIDLLLRMPDQCRNRRAALHLVSASRPAPAKVLYASSRRRAAATPLHVPDPMAVALRYGLIRRS